MMSGVVRRMLLALLTVHWQVVIFCCSGVMAAPGTGDNNTLEWQSLIYRCGKGFEYFLNSSTVPWTQAVRECAESSADGGGWHLAVPRTMEQNDCVFNVNIEKNLRQESNTIWLGIYRENQTYFGVDGRGELPLSAYKNFWTYGQPEKWVEGACVVMWKLGQVQYEHSNKGAKERNRRLWADSLPDWCRVEQKFPFVCQRATRCHAPTMAHGSIRPHPPRYGLVTVTCDQNFHIADRLSSVSTANAFCNSQGEIIPPLPRCKAQQCILPDTSFHNGKFLSKGEERGLFAVNTSAVFSCDSGHTLRSNKDKGQLMLVCIENGTWSPALQPCVPAKSTMKGAWIEDRKTFILIATSAVLFTVVVIVVMVTICRRKNTGLKSNGYEDYARFTPVLKVSGGELPDYSTGSLGEKVHHEQSAVENSVQHSEPTKEMSQSLLESHGPLCDSSGYLASASTCASTQHNPADCNSGKAHQPSCGKGRRLYPRLPRRLKTSKKPQHSSNIYAKLSWSQSRANSQLMHSVTNMTTDIQPASSGDGHALSALNYVSVDHLFSLQSA